MFASFQTAFSPSSRATGFVPANEAISAEVRTFGAAFMVLWMLLLAFMFVTRRRQRALRVEVVRLEATLGSAPDNGE